MEDLPDPGMSDRLSRTRQVEVAESITEMVSQLPAGDTIFGVLLEQELQEAVDQHMELVQKLGESSVQSIASPSETPLPDLISDEPTVERLDTNQLELALFTTHAEVKAYLDDFTGYTYQIAHWLVQHRGQKIHPRTIMKIVPGLKPATLSIALRRIREHHFLGQLLRVENQKINRTYGIPDDEGSCDNVVVLRQRSDFPRKPSSADTPGEPSQEFRYALRHGTAHETPLTLTGLSISEYQGERHVYFEGRLVDLEPRAIIVLHIVALHPRGIGFDQLLQILDQVSRARHTPAYLIDQLLKIEQKLPPESGWRKFYEINSLGQRKLMYKLEDAVSYSATTKGPDFLSSVRPELMRQQLARWTMQA